jgi:hypothetical protein
MPFTRSWTPLQKWLILASTISVLVVLGVVVFYYERYYRGPGDEVLVGSWEIPGSMEPRVCYNFRPDHTIYVCDCGDTESAVRGRWYAGGSNIYLNFKGDSDFLGQGRPLIMHIVDIQPDTLRVTLWRGDPVHVYRRFVARDDPPHLTRR